MRLCSSRSTQYCNQVDVAVLALAASSALCYVFAPLVRLFSEASWRL